ncbi:MAG: TlpA disulfide reductase family protein [Pyrinomonadaceae bacterium]
MKKLSIVVALLAIFTATAWTQTSVKLKGQVVCSLCWFEADDRKAVPYGTDADFKCARECADKGLPRALAVENEKGFTIYTLEEGTYKADASKFMDHLARTVEIEGEVRIQKDENYLKVNSLRVLDQPVSKPMPVSDFAVLALKDLAGVDQSLAGMRGRVVILNFWATWCVPCRKEMPDLAAIQNDYAPLGVQVIGASADEAAQRSKVLKFIKETKINFPVWLGATAEDMLRFGVGTVLPATVIIDREGKIVWREIGMIKTAELRKELDKLLIPKGTDAQKVAQKPKKASLVPA